MVSLALDKEAKHGCIIVLFCVTDFDKAEDTWMSLAKWIAGIDWHRSIQQIIGVVPGFEKMAALE